MAKLDDEFTPVAMLVFDGKNDRAELGKQPQFKIEQALTLEAWIYPKQYQSKWTGIVSCIYDTGATESGYGLLLDGKTGVKFGLTPSSSNRIVYLSSKANSLKLNQWQHIVGTFDGEQMQVYIDGVLKATRSVSSPGICYKPENDLLIGMYQDNNQTYSFQGMIAEVRLWNIVRPPAQLLSDRQWKLTGTEPGLVGYWQLNEGLGNQVHDKTSNANHGILQGNPSWEVSNLSPAAEKLIEPSSPSPTLTTPENSAQPKEVEPVPTVVQEVEGFETMTKTKAQSAVAPIAPAPTQGRQLVLSLGENHQGITAGSGALKPRSRFTIEAWVSPATNAGKQVIYSEGETLFYLEAGDLKFQTATAEKAIASVGAGITSENWYHVAVIRGGRRSGKTKLYINGNQNDNQAAIPAVLTVGSTCLGSQPDVADSCFEGKLLEVRVWRYARSQAEIQENMVYFLTGRELGLVRCWTGNEGFGSAIGDKTTNRAGGTLIGDATWEESEIPIKTNLNAQERLTRSTGLEDYGYWYKEMTKQQKTEADPHFRRGRIWA